MAGLLPWPDLSTLFASPVDPNRVFAGFGVEFFRALVYRTLDGGRTWSLGWQRPKSANPLSEGFVVSFAALARTHTLILCDPNAVYRSTDGGSTWVRSTAGLPKNVFIWTSLAATDGSAYVGTGETGIYRSANDGQTWQPLSS
jgi:photosystem II stability/assembly factor-like uncharacterized protein